MSYQFPLLPIVDSAGEATDVAIAWQQWQSEQSMSYGEVIEWNSYFRGLAEKFPEIKDEYEENGII